MRPLQAFAAVVAVAAFGCGVRAQESPPAKVPDLKVGDDAPTLAVAKWLKDDPGDRFRNDRVYVISFWAPWHAPCVPGMAHLTQLQKKYSETVVVVGVAGLDRWGTTLPGIEKFISRHPDLAGYSMAVDAFLGTTDPVFKGHTYSDYVMDAGLNSVPWAFVVDKEGRVAFVGLPMEIDSALAEVVAGTFDIAAAVRGYSERLKGRGELERFAAKMKAGEFESAYTIAGPLVEGPLASDASALLTIAARCVDEQVPGASRAPDLAIRAAARANELTGGREPMALAALARAHWAKGQGPEALRFQRAAVGLALGDQRAALEKDLAAYAHPATPEK